LLNPHEEGFPWTLDPRWAQLTADKYLFRTAMSLFHQNPFTVGVLVSFLKIKQLEDQMIRVAAEGLRLGANETQLNEYVRDIFNA
jgi:vacuolar-type H+-ATPase subunit C/Vma6